MASLNLCQFIGNLGADPETRRTAGGDPVVNMRIAVTDTWKDRDGNKKERTEWVSLVVWGEGLCKVAETYLKKGSRIYVSGSMQTRAWEDQSGQKRYSTEVVLGKFDGKLIMLDGPSGDKQAGSQRQEPDRGGRDFDDADSIPF